MKTHQRVLAKDILSSISEDTYFEKSKCLSKVLSQFLRDLNFHFTKVGVFSPIQKEPLWFLEFEDNYNYYLPTMLDDIAMGFIPADFHKVVKGEYGLKIDGTDFDEPQVLIIPGLAFTKTCKRLGRGKGYYDRYLATFKGLKVGICFEEQLLEDLETTSLDVNMDYVVTDKTVYKGIK
ncbi:MAG: 5-formyltetrahydrofolate cyclo-ligase [Bacteriovoracaceae bacterium]|nr:5-formyltetrahydrofolate cyclo-ligase [Bacteriovoracaceae bacterium]